MVIEELSDDGEHRTGDEGGVVKGEESGPSDDGGGVTRDEAGASDDGEEEWDIDSEGIESSDKAGDAERDTDEVSVLRAKIEGAVSGGGRDVDRSLDEAGGAETEPAHGAGDPRAESELEGAVGSVRVCFSVLNTATYESKKTPF